MPPLSCSSDKQKVSSPAIIDIMLKVRAHIMHSLTTEGANSDVLLCFLMTNLVEKLSYRCFSGFRERYGYFD